MGNQSKLDESAKKSNLINPYLIFLEFLYPGKGTLYVDGNYYIYELKQLIEEKCNMPVTKQRILFQGRILEDNRILDDYNIQHNSKLYVIPRLMGT